jgi:hypothetical protein
MKIGIRLACLAILFFAGGCSHWSIEKQDQLTARHIDSRIQLDMGREEFLAAFPTAQLLSSDGDRAHYLVYEQNTCFLCHSGQGFVRSNDLFARTIVFERNSLAEIGPVREVGR